MLNCSTEGINKGRKEERTFRLTTRIVHQDTVLNGARVRLGIGAEKKRKGREYSGVQGDDVDCLVRGESGLEGGGAAGGIYEHVNGDSERAAHGDY